MSPFITPHEQSAVKVKLLETGRVDEALKLAHAPPIEIRVIFVSGMINHIEIICEQPWI
jgi:hypothetical protein